MEPAVEVAVDAEEWTSMIKYGVLCLGLLLFGIVLIRVMGKNSRKHRPTDSSKFHGKFKDHWNNQRRH
jgi:hypothetical protein